MIFGFFNMTSPLTFLRETQDELKKVTWPTQQEITRLTLVVVAISLLVGFYVGALDYIFTKVIQIIVNK